MPRWVLLPEGAAQDVQENFSQALAVHAALIPAAKIHLTIAVDDTVSLNPGATLSNPLDKTVATRLIPATVETFSLGIGAGFTTEAIRTEDIEFLVSFSDMLTEFQKSDLQLYNGCKFDNGLFLESELGLVPLVDSALDPVRSGVLYQGNDVGPGVAAVAIPPSQLNNIAKQLAELKTVSAKLPEPSPDQSISDLASLLQDKSQLNKLIKTFPIPSELMSKSKNQLALEQKIQPTNATTIETILTYSADATTEEKRTQAIINNVVKPLYTIASMSLDASCLTKATQNQFQSITWAAKVSISVIDVQNATDVDKAKDALQAVKNYKNKVVEFATEMVSEIAACSVSTKKQKPKGPPQYDPIDVISETVNFFVTGSGSVTPGWKLARVSAPLSPLFLSASRKDTNTLILAMGRPAPAAGGGIIGSSAMNQQILAAILSQAISNQRVGP